MAIQAFVTSVYSAIVSWTYILLTILIVYKIISFFTGSGGGGGLFGGKGGKDKYDNDSRRIIDDISEDDKKKRKEKDKNDEPGGLDVTNPSYVKVIVWDEDDNPIQRAKVKITPARMKKRKWLKTKMEWREYGGLTGPDGIWPSGGKAEQIGSGTINIEVSKVKFYNITWFSKGRYYQKKDYELIAGEENEIVIILARKGEKAEWFEPKVLEVKSIDDKTMMVKGIIK